MQNIYSILIFNPTQRTNAHMDIHELNALGFNNEYDAESTEQALGIRFSEFTPEDFIIWKRQDLFFKQYSLTQVYERAARRAGVTVATVREWERLNTLGFVKKKEVAELQVTDMVQEILLEMAEKPDSPPLVLLLLLHMNMPEQFGLPTPEEMADDPPGPTVEGIRQLVGDEYVRIVREEERLLDEEELRVKSEIGDSVSSEDLPSERVSYWPPDDSDRFRNN